MSNSVPSWRSCAFPGSLYPADHKPCNLPFTTLGTLFKGRGEFLADLKEEPVAGGWAGGGDV